MSSTYINIKIIICPWKNRNNEESTMEAVKPSSKRAVDKQ
jgi:hypothetical protein